jgi:hypothetical protein
MCGIGKIESKKSKNKGQDMPETKTSSPFETQTVTINYSDSARFPVETCKWSDNGISLRTKWHFPSGAELEMDVLVKGEKHQCVGVVVACERIPDEPGQYMTTLYFIEPPCNELKKATRALAIGSGAKQI